jgi:aminopeptidase N
LLEREVTIAHEMAHMWFGDLVTMRWWDDLWLNESFAEYLAHRCCSEVTRYPQWTEFGIRRKAWGAAADQSPSTHPVAGNGSVDAASALAGFDGISYAKGAAVLKQLATYLGDEVFLGGLRTYMDRYAFGNAEFAELMAAWTGAGAVDLEGWAASWLQTSGMDTLDVRTEENGVQVLATGPDGTPSPRVHATTVGRVDADAVVHPVEQLALRGRSGTLALPAETLLVLPDAEDATWAKVRFGPYGWDGVSAVLAAVTEEPVLVVLYNAVRDAVRDGGLATGRALELVTGSLGRQQSVVLLSVVGAFAAETLAGPFSPVADRSARLARVHAVAEEVVRTSDAGSDRQLTGFRLAVQTSADQERLQAWAAGRSLPPRLALDRELTWAVVQRLTTLSGDVELIDRTLAQDPSSSAVVHAVRARAALPSAAAKEEAWDLIMQPSPASAYELYAAAEGFWQAGQTELTRPYVARYFAEIGATAQFRGGLVLARLARAAFPRLAVERETVRLAEQTLAGDLAAGIRRELVDGLDQLSRALNSLTG